MTNHGRDAKNDRNIPPVAPAAEPAEVREAPEPPKRSAPQFEMPVIASSPTPLADVGMETLDQFSTRAARDATAPTAPSRTPPPAAPPEGFDALRRAASSGGFKRPAIEVPRAPNFAAHDELQRIRNAEQEMRLAAEADMAKAYQFFIKCRRGHVGCFLTINPSGLIIALGHWFTSYRRIEDPWREEVYCQVCFDTDPESGEPRGSIEPLQVTYVAGGRGFTKMAFVVAPKFVWRYPIDPQRFRDEGSSRAARVDYGSGNLDWTPTEEQERLAQQRRREALKLYGGV